MRNIVRICYFIMLGLLLSTLFSCTSNRSLVDYCPAYASQTGVDCENCDEID